MNLTQNIKDKFLDNFNMLSGTLRSMRGDPQAWEASIRRFETRERLRPAPAGAILFTGSSSILLVQPGAGHGAPAGAQPRLRRLPHA
jgi:hypothetical protein